MKNLILSLCIALSLTACINKSSTTVVLDSAGKVVSAVNAPVIKFEKEIYDFGVIRKVKVLSTSLNLRIQVKHP